MDTAPRHRGWNGYSLRIIFLKPLIMKLRRKVSHCSGSHSMSSFLTAVMQTDQLKYVENLLDRTVSNVLLILIQSTPMIEQHTI